jgi:Tfp pilus assembly protein PilN
MTQPAPDPRVDPVRAAIDGTFMLVLARFFMPIVVAVLGYFLTGTLDDLRRDNRTMQSQISHLSEQQAQVGAVMSSTVKQLDRLQIQVDSLPRHN